MAASFINPKVTNPILSDVNTIQELLGYLAKANPSLGTEYPEGSIRLFATGTNNTLFQLQRFDGVSWVTVGQLQHDVTTLQGYTPSVNAVANTIPVYNEAGRLVGSITGTAASATKLEFSRNIQIGGVVSSDAQLFNGTSDITIPINNISINNANDNAVNGILSIAHGGTGNSSGIVQDVSVSSLAGDVTASAYGQIGQAISMGDADFNSLVVDGRYIVTNTSGATKHQPSKTNISSYLQVTSSGTSVFQLFYNSSEMWMRQSIDSGATWQNWSSIMGTRQEVVMYVSKSGSDNNTGLESAYPVLTIDRALAIASGLIGGGAINIIYLNLGEGNWGTVKISGLRSVVFIRPYDGSVPTKYSSSLPYFDDLTFSNQQGCVQGIVCSFLSAQEGSSISIVDRYNRLGAIYVIGNSFIFIWHFYGKFWQQRGLLEVGVGGNTNKVGFFFLASASLVSMSNLLEIRLVTNIDYPFARLHQGGRLEYDRNSINVNTNGFSCTSNSYLLLTGSSLYDGTGNPNLRENGIFPGGSMYLNNGASINGFTIGTVTDTDLNAAKSELQGNINTQIAGVNNSINSLRSDVSNNYVLKNGSTHMEVLRILNSNNNVMTLQNSSNNQHYAIRSIYYDTWFREVGSLYYESTPGGRKFNFEVRFSPNGDARYFEHVADEAGNAYLVLPQTIGYGGNNNFAATTGTVYQAAVAHTMCPYRFAVFTVYNNTWYTIDWNCYLFFFPDYIYFADLVDLLLPNGSTYSVIIPRGSFIPAAKGMRYKVTLGPGYSRDGEIVSRATIGMAPLISGLF